MELRAQDKTQGPELAEEKPPIVSITESVPETIKPVPGDAEMLSQLELGFMFGHSLLSEASWQTLSAATAAFALADLLIEQGVIEEAELKARRDEVQSMLLEQDQRTGLGLFVDEEHKDKYTLTCLPKINCAERLHLCRSACCLLRFPLSRQDVEEGVVRLDFGRPYWNLRTRSGYCIHNNPEKQSCQIYESRPAPCRLYDCSQDKRIWLDFEAMIVNPDLATSFANPTR